MTGVGVGCGGVLCPWEDDFTKVCTDPDTHMQKSRLSNLMHTIWQLEKKRKEKKQQPCSRNVISKLTYSVTVLHVI